MIHRICTCKDWFSVCLCIRLGPTCPRLPYFQWQWGPQGRFPSGHTAAAPWLRQRSPGRAPHTRATPMSACRSCSWCDVGNGGKGNEFRRNDGIKMRYRIRREECENVLQIGKNDAWNRVRGLCCTSKVPYTPTHPHTYTDISYSGINTKTDTVLRLSRSSQSPLVLF